MKILYVDISLRGHRVGYLKALVSGEYESIALLPDQEDSILCRQYVIKSGYDKKRSLKTYLAWIKEIKELVNVEHPDVVHFLCGDALYRYMGVGLSNIDAKIIITYHHMLFGGIRTFSLKRIFKNSHYGIVHTEHLEEQLKKHGVENGVYIQYPVLVAPTCIDMISAKEILGIPQNIKCIVVLGGTQRYKGIDILLTALQKVNVPFFLYVTGVERDFSLEQMKNMCMSYSKNVMFNMNRLTDEEYSIALAATDIMVLPYRHEFDGASGPMVEAVWERKYIVGAEHGSMGSIIRKFGLGETFTTENPDSLAEVLNKVLCGQITWSEEAEKLREELTVEKFLCRYSILYREMKKYQ